ncbi:MAG: CoA transferase [Candidatus Dormibacteraeota bacterium]|nr:CoA transferase [Candidatus Dormibacteraeota bacterium]MBO0706279.1 CoA transferase [Candidatus Dormibacteraeota bacterium]MBO0759738.1 CoA transferase [Candidatus Dormibacteraeota bacterium]
MPGSLHGIRVVDVTASVAGPFTTEILGDLGADVIKVERTEGGDDTRRWGPPFWEGESVMFLALNRNKRSLALDLHHERGREVLWRLLESADVLVQNLRPGALSRHGFSYEAVSRVNPRLIYCDMTGYGPHGPRRDQSAYDPMMQAFSGLMSVTGEEGRPPARIPASILDQGTALWTVIGVLDALRTRDATGRGTLLETSLLMTALPWLPVQFTTYFASGQVPERLGSGAPGIAPYQAFPTADEYLIIAAGNDGLWQRLCGVLQREDLLSDPRFVDNPSRVRHRHELFEEMSRTLRTRPRDEWVAELAAVQVPATPIQTLDQVTADQQVVATGMFQREDHPRIDGFTIINTPVLEDREYMPVRRVPPEHGEHTREVLAELGYEEAAVAELMATGAAGPVAGPAAEDSVAR